MPKNSWNFTILGETGYEAAGAKAQDLRLTQIRLILILFVRNREK